MITKPTRFVLLELVGESLFWIRLTSADWFNKGLEISINDKWHFLCANVIFELDESFLFWHFDEFIALANLFMNFL